MKKSLGILGGMGPMATADLFAKIVRLTNAGQDNDHIRIYIDCNPAIPDRTAAILSGGEDPVPAMKESLKKLENCGADVIIMPCNTAHYFLPRLKALTDTPFLDITECAASASKAHFGAATAAVLATEGTIRSGLYQRALDNAGVPYLTPDPDEQAAIMRVIYDGVKAGREPSLWIDDMLFAIDSLSRRGAYYFILACTELPLAADAVKLTVPTVDPTEELARAAIRYCGYEVR